MDIEEIRELVRLMVENDLAELDITDGDSKIRLKRGPGGEIVGQPVPVPAFAPAAAAEPAPPAEGPEEEKHIEIRSPMVGTFYAAPSPDSDPYVTVGSRVGEDTVVCIIEAMKVMNEIKAERAGTVVEICVQNAHPVEYGQPLFKVKPQ
jgi:acetyl-CoA carboxylase biotin carboxyl carrier protein